MEPKKHKPATTPKIVTTSRFFHALCKRSFFDVSAEVLENVDPIFYGDVKQAAFKALGLN
jgi:hypothetical protein